MNKKAKTVFIIGSVTGIIILLTSIILINMYTNKDNLTEMARLRYIIVFFTVLGLMNSTVLIREYLNKDYNEKKFKIKVIVSILTLVIGGAAILIIKPFSFVQVVTLIGMGVYLYTLSPAK